MRILHLGINYWPDETGIAPFNTLRCEYLASCGHEVAALTAFPYYPQWRVPVEYRRRIYVREERNGVALIRTWMYVPGKATSFKRVMHEASFSLSVILSAISKSRPDVIFAVSPPLPLTISARILSRLWGIPYVLHIEDLQPDAAVDLGMLRTGRLTDALYALERDAYRGAALVSTLNDAMARRIRAKGIAADKTAIIPHGADTELYGVLGKVDRLRFREIHGLQGKFLVVHAGNMGVKQGLEVIIDAAGRSRENSELMYLLVGDGANRPALERRAASENLSNVRFLPQLPRSEFHELLATADLSLVTQQRAVADILFPSKVETLMAVGQPIVASLGGASTVADVLRKSGAGEVVRPEDPSALLNAILSLKRDPDRRALMASRGQAYAREHWNRAAALDSMESSLMDVCSGREVRAASQIRAAALDSVVPQRRLFRLPLYKGLFRNGRHLGPEEKDGPIIRP
jgi:colanic acid biosynthesis glycosyl transferase WcaI